MNSNAGVNSTVSTHTQRPSLASRRQFIINPIQSIGSNVRQKERECVDDPVYAWGKGKPWWSVPARLPASYLTGGVLSSPFSCLPLNKSKSSYPNLALPPSKSKFEPFSLNQGMGHSKAFKFIPHTRAESLQTSEEIPLRRTLLDLVRVLTTLCDPDGAGRWSLPHPIAYQQLLSALCDSGDHHGLDRTACNPHFLTQFLISDSLGRERPIRINLPADSCGCLRGHTVESVTELAEGEVGVCLLEQLLEQAAKCLDSATGTARTRTAQDVGTPPASMARRAVEDRLQQARSFVREHACRLQRWPALAVVLSARGATASATPLWRSRALEHVRDALDALHAGRAFRAELDASSNLHQRHAAAETALKLERWIVPCLLHGCFAAISDRAVDEAFGLLEFTHGVLRLSAAAAAPDSPDGSALGWTERLAGRDGGTLLADCRAAIALQREGLAQCRSCFDDDVIMWFPDRAPGCELLERERCGGVRPAPGPVSGPPEDRPAGLLRCIASLRRSPAGEGSPNLPSLSWDPSAGGLHPDAGAEARVRGGWLSAAVIVSGAPPSSAGIRRLLFSRIMPEIGRRAVEFHGMMAEFLDLEAMDTRHGFSIDSFSFLADAVLNSRQITVLVLFTILSESTPRNSGQVYKLRRTRCSNQVIVLEISLDPVDCLPALRSKFKPENTELEDRFAAMSGDSEPTKVDTNDEHREIILSTEVGEEIWDLLMGFATLKIAIQPTSNAVASSVKDPISQQKPFCHPHGSFFNVPSSYSPAGGDIMMGSDKSNVGRIDETTQFDLECWLSRKELMENIAAAVLTWSVTSERTQQLVMIEIVGASASGKTAMLNSVVKTLHARGFEQYVIRFDTSTELSIQTSWWSFRTYSGRAIMSQSCILIFDTITSDAYRCLNEMNWIRQGLRSTKNQQFDFRFGLRHKVKKWLLDMANVLLFSNICVLYTTTAHSSFQLSTVTTTSSAFPASLFQIRALDVRERIATISRFLQANKVQYSQRMISELVSKRMSGRPMYIALAAQTLAMIFGNTENAESNTGNMGLMTNVEEYCSNMPGEIQSLIITATIPLLCHRFGTDAVCCMLEMLSCCDLGIACLFDFVQGKHGISQIAYYALCHDLVCLDLCHLLLCGTIPTLRLQHKGLILSIVKDFSSSCMAISPIQDDDFKRIQYFSQTARSGIKTSVTDESPDETVLNHSLGANSLQADDPGPGLMASLLKECENDVKSSGLCADFSVEILGVEPNLLSQTEKLQEKDASYLTGKIQETSASYHLERVSFFHSLSQVSKSVISKTVDKINGFECIKSGLVSSKECQGKIHDPSGIMALVLVKKVSSSSWYIASGGYDGKIKVWLVKLCFGDFNSSKELGILPDVNHVSSFASKNLVHSLTGHSGAILSMVIHKDVLFSGSSDCDIRGWDTDDGACLTKRSGHKLAVVSLAANAEFLISGGSDSIIRQWTVRLDWGTRGKYVIIECIRTFDNKSSAAINCLLLDQDTIFCARERTKNEEINAIDIWSLEPAKDDCSALPSTMIQDMKFKLRELNSLQTILNEQLLAMRVKRRTASIRNQKILDQEASSVRLKLSNVEMELKTVSCSLGRGRLDLCHAEDIYCFYRPETMPDILFSGGSGSDIFMWDLKSGSCINTLETRLGSTQVGCTRNLTGIMIGASEILLSAGCDESGHIGKIWLWMFSESASEDICCAEVDAEGINCLLVIGNHILAGDSKGNLNLFAIVNSQK